MQVTLISAADSKTKRSNKNQLLYDFFWPIMQIRAIRVNGYIISTMLSIINNGRIALKILKKMQKYSFNINFQDMKFLNLYTRYTRAILYVK